MATGKTLRVAIVGAGVIGLSIGWKLARAGASVTVFERGRAGRGASFAAGGMLAATLESEEKPAALARLARHSLSLWPHFADELEGVSAVPIHYRSEGTLLIALGAADSQALQARFARLHKDAREVSWLDGAETRALEPNLAPEVWGAILSPGDHQVDNRNLSQALAEALCREGGKLCEESLVTNLLIEGDICKGVVVAGAPQHADVVIVSAGAWSGALGVDAVRPVKGQMLSLAVDPTAPLLRHVVWAPDAYLVPRTDRVIVGATMEEAGFDESIVPATIETLRMAACRALPALAVCPIIERWMGFRPGTADGLPFIGPSRFANLIFATGHHRNGILLAPVTAEIVAELVLQARLSPLAAAFDPRRSRAELG